MAGPRGARGLIRGAQLEVHTQLCWIEDHLSRHVLYLWSKGWTVKSDYSLKQLRSLFREWMFLLSLFTFNVCSIHYALSLCDVV